MELLTIFYSIRRKLVLKTESYYNQLMRLNPTWDSKAVRNITFQVTEKCPLECTYCYQKNKTLKSMTIDTARECVNLLFKMWENNDPDGFINKDTKALIFDFIGGEPFSNINVIEFICDYFFNRCLQLQHPWLPYFRISIISNGELYFTRPVLKFIEKWNNFLSFGITIDGPRDLHNACRVNKNGVGNFDKAFLALQHYSTCFNKPATTKVTISPDNLNRLSEIAEFFYEKGFTQVNANPAFEPEWTATHAREYYKQLKEIANFALAHNDIEFSFFNKENFCPLNEEHNNVYCGGNGAMIAFDPQGDIYPCVRYMDSSLNGAAIPLKIGTKTGWCKTEEQKQIITDLQSITRRSESTDECFNCAIARGCGECLAWNYQASGQLNKRNTNICWMHRAASLANCYYWNMYFRQNKSELRFALNLEEDLALQIIDRYEYLTLKTLSGI